MMLRCQNLFERIVSVESLFLSWMQFRRGKRNRKDVQIFERHLEKNIFDLHFDLSAGTYQHGEYCSFFINDPKVRHIRKATVRDRLVHQSVHNELARIYEPKFIFHSYSCRIAKGTHLAINNLRRMIWKESRNLTSNIWALKCDIRKFYDSVDHLVLLKILRKTVREEWVLSLLKKIINSFHVEGAKGKGLPIGNLTSQICTNIYLNDLDQFIKHELKAKYYLRYADDFMILSREREKLEPILLEIKGFLKSRLKLELHPQKVIFRNLNNGLDFLGYVTLPYHRTIRTKTKRRMIKRINRKEQEFYSGKIDREGLLQTLASYSGYIGHADSFKLRQEQLGRRYIL